MFNTWSEEKASKRLRILIMVQFLFSVLGFVALIAGLNQTGFLILVIVPLLAIANMAIMVKTELWQKNKDKSEKENEEFMLRL